MVVEKVEGVDELCGCGTCWKTFEWEAVGNLRLRKATMDGGGNGSLFFASTGLHFEVGLQVIQKITTIKRSLGGTKQKDQNNIH